MLGGIDPILVFTFASINANATANSAISAVPLIGDAILENLGVPIPLYLSEKLTGISVDTESIDITVDSNVQLNKVNNEAIVDQKGLNSILTVNMISTKSSLVLAALVAFTDVIFSRLVSKSAKISYIHGSTIVLNALLHSFTMRQREGSDLVDVVLQLEKSNITPVTPGKDINAPSIGKKVATEIPGLSDALARTA